MGESSKRILRMNFLVLLTACAAAANALDVQKILTPKNGEVAALSCKNGKANLAKDTEVTIETPNYPENYPDRVKCNWKIRVPANEEVHVWCETFDVAKGDSLRVKDGKGKPSKVFGTYAEGWGETIPASNKRRNIAIQFRSNKKKNAGGFRCQVAAVAPGSGQTGSGTSEPICQCGNKGGAANDFAILRLSSPVTFTTEVAPACLPADVKQTYKNKVATVTGWGTLESGGQQPTVLHEVDLTITTNKYCKEQYGWGISKNMICAMGPESGGKDSCQGDSGGPLVVKENGHHAVVGVVSWGAGCAEPETPGVYARVTAQMSWILENTSGTLSSTCAALN